MIYTNRSINIICFFITCFICTIIIFLSEHNIKNDNIDFPNVLEKKIAEFKQENNTNDENTNSIEIGNWYIEIPAISLKAPISETTNMEILNSYIGHFEETSLEKGNIGLAGHNRGYEHNYFENLKSVQIGDKIKYYYKDFQSTYTVDKTEIIENTDWSYLEKTEENKITLITCVENEPNYRRVVQATEDESNV